jgi:excisionase family DNA binding protein
MGGGMEVYLTTKELAVMLKLSEQTIRRYVLNRVIPFRKIKTSVRFRLSEIEKWISCGCADNFVISDNAVISDNSVNSDNSVIGGEADGGLFPETSDLQETDGDNKAIL